MLAHGLGGRTDLPLPVWMFAYGAGGVLVLSFVALGVLWRRPILARAASGRAILIGATPSRVLFVIGRIVGLLAFGVTLAAAIFGPANGAANFGPVAVCIVFWVGAVALSPLLGDLYWLLHPFDTLARVLRLPETTARRAPGQWTSAALLLSFVWLELAYHEGCGDPRALATWLVSYTVAVMAGAVVWGRGWLRFGEGFAGLFGLVAAMAPIHHHEGRLALRPPLAGLATVEARSGTTALVLVALGSTTFDGFTRSALWTDIIGVRVGWDRTIVSTIGLVWIIAIVALAYLVAVRVAGGPLGRDTPAAADTFVASLLPIVVAYASAHYFSLFLLEGQSFLALVSDPFGRGWDLFGTINNTIRYSVVSPRTISYVQVAAIVVGHVLGVATAHDRAIELAPRRKTAALSQYPLLAVMLLYTVGGLTLLLQS